MMANKVRKMDWKIGWEYPHPLCPSLHPLLPQTSFRKPNLEMFIASRGVENDLQTPWQGTCAFIHSKGILSSSLALFPTLFPTLLHPSYQQSTCGFSSGSWSFLAPMDFPPRSFFITITFLPENAHTHVCAHTRTCTHTQNHHNLYPSATAVLQGCENWLICTVAKINGC